jgi:hypothetical protein
MAAVGPPQPWDSCGYAAVIGARGLGALETNCNVEVDVVVGIAEDQL